LLEPGDEEDAGLVPLPEEIEIVIAPIHGDDAAGGKRKTAGCDHVSGLALGNHGEVGEIAVMVQEQMELDGALGLAGRAGRKLIKTPPGN
jgi:hypothetical protein